MTDGMWEKEKDGGKEVAQVYDLSTQKGGTATFKAETAERGTSLGDPGNQPSLFGSRKFRMIPHQSLTKPKNQCTMWQRKLFNVDVRMLLRASAEEQKGLLTPREG